MARMAGRREKLDEARDQLRSVEHLELGELTPDTTQWGAGKRPTRDSAPSRAVTDQDLIASCADLPQWPAACQHPHGVSSADLHNVRVAQVITFDAVWSGSRIGRSVSDQDR